MIVSLGEQYKEEARARETLVAQMNEKTITNQLKQRPGEAIDMSMSHMSHNQSFSNRSCIKQQSALSNTAQKC